MISINTHFHGCENAGPVVNNIICSNAEWFAWLARLALTQKSTHQYDDFHETPHSNYKASCDTNQPVEEIGL